MFHLVAPRQPVLALWCLVVSVSPTKSSSLVADPKTGSPVNVPTTLSFESRGMVAWLHGLRPVYQGNPSIFPKGHLWVPVFIFIGISQNKGSLVPINPQLLLDLTPEGGMVAEPLLSLVIMVVVGKPFFYSFACLVGCFFNGLLEGQKVQVIIPGCCWEPLYVFCLLWLSG